VRDELAATDRNRPGDHHRPVRVASLVGSSPRTDGTTQVTYGGKPLYYFKGDTAPGDAKGQGLNNVWYILGPKANIMK